MRFIIRTIFRLGVTILLTLIVLINIKGDSKFKDKFYNLVYEDNLDFAYINSLYKQYFGEVIPFQNMIYTQPVFNEELVYDSYAEYLDGIKLTVGADYLVPALNGGLVVFVGEKEGYGQVVVIEQTDGIDCWYGGLDTINVKLYDYVEEGSLLGSVSGGLYLVFKQNGEIVSYEKYLQ